MLSAQCLTQILFTDEEEREDFNPSLYIPSDWISHLASNGIKTRITDFHNLLASTRRDILCSTHSSTNLTPSQLYPLDWLKDHPKFIILNTDKNIGPAIMEREKYI